MLWRIHLDPKIASLSACGPWDGMQLIPLEPDRHLLRSALGSNGHWHCQADTGRTEGARSRGLSIREIGGGTRLGAPTLVLVVFLLASEFSGVFVPHFTTSCLLVPYAVILIKKPCMNGSMRNIWAVLWTSLQRPLFLQQEI